MCECSLTQTTVDPGQRTELAGPTQIRLRSTLHLQQAEWLAAATETMNPIALALARARVPALAQPEREQIHPASERSSSTQAAPARFQELRPGRAACCSSRLCGLPLRATLFHDALGSSRR